MRVRVQKWGNSLALRIPKPFAGDVDVSEGCVRHSNEWRSCWMSAKPDLRSERVAGPPPAR
jgi:hypothetical protein